MTDRLRLIVFDVDGTLVDSQADIIAAMASAFARADLVRPQDSEIKSIVGLSLDVAIARLSPESDPALLVEMVDWYKDAYMALRAERGAAESSPLYPGVAEGLTALSARPDYLLGVATGKSQRGLDKLLEGHALTHHFVTRQVADHHPSKPHPSMLFSALEETGVDIADAVMIGDTTYDRDMAAAAGMAFIGVGWGYHSREDLVGAREILAGFGDLPAALERVWSTAR